MTVSPLCLRRLLVAALTLAAAPLAAQDRFELGLVGTITTGDGEPSNDMIGVGAFARWRFDDDWRLAVGVDQYEYDFERPWRVLGLEQGGDGEVIDAKTHSTLIRAWVERELGAADRFFVAGGLGFASPDVDDAAGPTADGGSFDIEADAGTEIVLSLAGGVRWRMGARWGGEFALRADHHFADWTLRDRVSGRTGTIDDYTGLGGHLAFAYRF